ncbi:MAG: hypothetical protein EP343_30845 [Deltaproteobacteria bacterium]|nr:MAG: hypothetical protein EP343_30845 [Deltaproteobacteria bacterium]
MWRSKRAKTTLILGILACSLVFISCEYIARFIIRIDEGANFPCLGAYRLTFVIDALEEDQEDLANERVTNPNPQDSDLFWKPDGTCQIPKGILLKNIPYGGKRQLIIQAYDSSGLLVASGKSPTFTLEPSGEDVKDLIVMDFVRGCRNFDSNRCIDSQPVPLGTLIISFPPTAPIPQGSQSLFFQSAAVKDQNLPAINRTIKFQSNDLPTTVILTGIPASTSRTYSIHALDLNQQEIQRWSGTFTTPTPLVASNATLRLVAGVAKTTSP